MEARNNRIGYSFAIFYAVRSALQAVFTFKIPPGSTWSYPGFPSFMVPYGMMSDFYYSGHTGFLVLVIQERLSFNHKKEAFMTFLFAIYMVMILFIYRIHYTIGISS